MSFELVMQIVWMAETTRRQSRKPTGYWRSRRTSHVPRQVVAHSDKGHIDRIVAVRLVFSIWIHVLSCTLTYFNRDLLHTHTRLMALCPVLPRWTGTRKVKPVWILLKQDTVSGSGISWAICKCAPRSRQITMPAAHHSVFSQAGCPSCCPTNSVKALKAQQRSVSRFKKERGLNLWYRLQGITIIHVSWLAAFKINKTATVPHMICSDNYYYCYVR